MRSLNTVVYCVLLLAGCDQDKVADNDSGAAAPATPATPAGDGALSERATADSPAPSSGKLFAKDTGKDPCTLLTADMVAVVAGLDPAALTHQEIAGMCVYDWEGATPGKAKIGFIAAYETQEGAAKGFARSHKNMSGEQVAGAMKTIGEGAKAKLEADAAAGNKVPDAKLVAPVTKELANNSMGGGLKFEPVAGIGDEAAFETTRHETKLGAVVVASYANTLGVRAKNLKFKVSFSFEKKSADAEPVMCKAQCIALARAVLAGLAE